MWLSYDSGFIYKDIRNHNCQLSMVNNQLMTLRIIELYIIFTCYDMNTDCQDINIHGYRIICYFYML